MIRPEELVGHTRCGHYAIRAYRGNGCAGWLFAAERMSHSPSAVISSEFGGGSVGGLRGTRVMLEIASNGLSLDREELQNFAALHPHAHLARCLEAGQSQDQDLAGATYVAMEAWRDTLAQILTRRSILDEPEVRNVATSIAAALARYHSDNRMHGDVRAERICQVDGNWKLAPFLRRKANEGGADGAFAVMPQDDIYALGLVLLRCLSPKFSADRENNPKQLASQTEIEQAVREIPAFWQPWIRRCLAPDPYQRCSAAELALIEADMPSPLGAVSVDREEDPHGARYRVHWQPIDRGAVQVYRWVRGRRPAPGEIWLVADLERIADSVPLTMPTATHIQVQPGTACQIVVATVIGSAAVIGDSVTLTWAADVERLKVTVEGKAIAATWDWPAGAHLTQVVVREGAFPTGPNDPQARSERCFRAGYMAEGRIIIPIDPRAAVVHVTVYAIYRHEDGWEHASGRTTGARSAITLAPSIRLHYRVEKVSLLARILLNAEPCRLSMRIDQTATLPELTLVAGESHSPFDTCGGLSVLEVPSQQFEEGVVVQKDFRLPKGVKIENTRLLVRGTSCAGVRLIPERSRVGVLSM